MCAGSPRIVHLRLAKACAEEAGATDQSRMIAWTDLARQQRDNRCIQKALHGSYREVHASEGVSRDLEDGWHALRLTNLANM